MRYVKRKVVDWKLAKLRNLLQAATDGEWRTAECNGGGKIFLRGDDRGRGEDGKLLDQSSVQIVPAEDAEFITMAKNTMGELLDYVRALEVTNCALRKELKNVLARQGYQGQYCREVKSRKGRDIVRITVSGGKSGQ